MAGIKLLCDTGPLVAFLNQSDQYHRWAAEQFDNIYHPLSTCEAVVSEAIFLLHSDGLPADAIFEAIERGKLLVDFAAKDHWPDLRRLLKKYENLPMGLADACLVRMAELSRDCKVLTLDRHFGIYRRHGRHLIPLLVPF